MQFKALCNRPSHGLLLLPCDTQSTRVTRKASDGRFIAKTLVVMKLTAILLFITCLQVSAKTYSQTVTYSGKNVSLQKIFAAIEKQTGYVVFYDYRQITGAKPVTLEAKAEPLVSFLNRCFKEQPFGFAIEDKTIMITKKAAAPRPAEHQLGYEQAPPPVTPVTGKVVSVKGGPLEGASVNIKGSVRGTGTNAKGEFTINANPGDIVTVSYIGYNEVSFRITNSGAAIVEAAQTASAGGTTVQTTTPGGGLVNAQNGLTIVLSPSASPLDEVQIIAYGQTSRRFNTGNVTTVKGEDIVKQPVSNVLIALQGRVPGMAIQQTSGAPGGSLNVQIRGRASISNSTSPLYVIDGVPYDGGAYTNGSYNQNLNGGNTLNFLNNADIESVDVLKDADATAIYGSRGANGVILITTRKGKAGRTSVNIDAYSGIGHAARIPKLLNLRQYLQMRHEAKANTNAAVLPTDYDMNGVWDTTRYTDWAKYFMGNASHVTDVQASVAGGGDNTQYLIGAGYRNETTIFPISGGDKKASVHFSVNNTSPNKRLTTQLTGSFVNDINTVPTGDFLSSSLMAPDAPALFKPDGSLNWENNTFANPMGPLLGDYHFTTHNLLASALIGYHVIKGLDIKSSFGYNYLQTEEYKGSLAAGVNAALYPDLTTARQGIYNSGSTQTWTIEPQASYTTKVEKGTLSALVGGTFQRTTSNSQSITGNTYSSDQLVPNLKAAGKVTINGYSASEYKYNAAFGRINYNWDGKYIVNFTGRYDGSSRFGPGRQFHFFSAAGAAWIFTAEDFVHDNLRFLSFGKVRASYGTTGNDGLANYQYLDLYNTTTNPYQGVQGLYPGGLFNPDLAWEVNKKAEVGLDLGFLKDRILVNASFFRNRSSNMVQYYKLSDVTGFQGISLNLPALVQNTGLELSLNTVNVKSKSFTWSTYGTFTLPRNRLVSYPNFETSSLKGTYIVGMPLNIRLLYNYGGVDPQLGTYRYIDSAGKYTTNPLDKDRTAVVKLDPKFYGSLGNTFQYKNFTLDILFVYNKQTNTNAFNSITVPAGYANNNVIASEALPRWQKPGDISNVQRYSTSILDLINFINIKKSDRIYSDASFVRLKNVYLGYQLPQSVINKMRLQNLSVYLKGENLLVITSYKDLDPETASITPPVRMITAGIKVTL